MLKDEIIEQGNIIFNKKYDYSLLGNIKTKKEKFPIICPEHSVFYKNYEGHIRKQQGCPMCSGRKQYTTDEFVAKAKGLNHTKDYTFEETVYVNTKSKIKVYCHYKDEYGNEHGTFEITPSHLLSGEGCPICRYRKSSLGRRRAIEEILSQANEIHNYKYDYSLITSYQNDRIKYPIICPEHGVFEQTMNNHIRAKQGCPICGNLKCADSRRDTFATFVQKANLVHNNTYEYLDNNYQGSNIKIGITCKKHGVFYMTPTNHLIGQHCPKCAFSHSKGESELYEFIISLVGKANAIQRDRTILNGEELDIFIPSLAFAIEYNGLYWHSEISKDKNYHLNKTLKCEAKNIRLFHIFEDEWINKKDIIKSMLSSLILKNNRKIYARNCTVKNVSPSEARNFLNQNHLQGACNSQIRYGLFYNDELISLMTFGSSRHFIGNKNDKIELLRFCTKTNLTVVGGASKLFNYFINTNNVNEIVSYADRRWSIGNVYDKLGFELYNQSKPNYYYIIGGKRVYRYNLRKNILIKKYNCPKETTEKEFCYNQGWYRIYDCGCLCYKWLKK
jgi:hypothetical protein